MRAYKLTFDGCGVVDDSLLCLAEVVDWDSGKTDEQNKAITELEGRCKNLAVGEKVEIKNDGELFYGDFSVECIEISQDEIEAMPEFDGF